jgi:hypothetical protein
MWICPGIQRMVEMLSVGFPAVGSGEENGMHRGRQVPRSQSPEYRGLTLSLFLPGVSKEAAAGDIREMVKRLTALEHNPAAGEAIYNLFWVCG